MATPGWNQPQSPFHPGELAVQSRLGFQAQADRQGRRMIRTYLTEQHRQFFTQLPYVVVGTLDQAGRPWTSLLVGQPGFLSTPDAHSLQVATSYLAGDPLPQNLQQGCDVGFLGIDLGTRRRNRLNGKVTDIQAESFTVQVQQSFGNCPQYIQSRTLRENALHPLGVAADNPVHALSTLSPAETALITSADTFFITTAYQSRSAGLASGVDVSHRGGKPGFIKVEDNCTLTVPDFSGNKHFNTFGNLELNSRAGLLFIDFIDGHLLYLTGHAKVIWNGAAVEAFEGAERLLQFQLERGYWADGSLPLRWSTPNFSPYLANTGIW
ncbi:MAG: pyridoxamine 5'-phosphate oxidase family protein [Cyanobacteria bacterium J06631_9]